MVYTFEGMNDFINKTFEDELIEEVKQYIKALSEAPKDEQTIHFDIVGERTKIIKRHYPRA